MEVVPGLTNGVMSIIRSQERKYEAASWTLVGIIQLHDTCGNSRRRGEDLIEVFADGPGDTRVNAHITQATDGQYEAHMYTTAAGFYAISACIASSRGIAVTENDGCTGYSMHVAGSPWLVEFVPREISKHALVSGMALVAGAIAGSPTHLLLETMARNGTRRLKGALNLTVSRPFGREKFVDVVSTQILSQDSVYPTRGRYLVNFVLYTTGVYQLRILFDGKSTPVILVDIICHPSRMSVSWSAISAVLLSKMGHHVFIQSRDEFGNDIRSGGELIRIHVGGSRRAKGVVNDQGDGTYRFSMRHLGTGKYAMHVDLARSASVTLGGGGGLTAKYYASGNISGYPTLRREDRGPFVHDWGTRDIVAGAADHVAVHWTGLLASPQTALFRLNLKIADSDDSARVFIDGHPIAQSKTGSSFATGDVHLVRGGLYTISVEYFESTGPAAILLEWTNPEISKQPIPAYYLYPRGESFHRSPFVFEVTL